jgi:tetratricopeptide (TPR) repeat protein
MYNQLELKQASATSDIVIAPQADFSSFERVMSLFPQIIEGVSQKEPLIWMLLKIANVYQEMGERETAIRYYEQLLKLTAEASYPHIRAEAFRGLGNMQFSKGQWTEAQTYDQQSLALFEAENDLGRSASIYNQFGYIAAQQGDYQRATAYHQKAIEMAQQIASPTDNGYQRLMACAYNSLGIIASIQARWEASIDYFEKSILIYEELALPREAAHIYTNLAMAYVDAEEWEAAGACYEEATTLAEKSGNLLTLSGIYINRAEFLLDIASIDAAQLYCDKALALFQKTNDNIGIAEAYKLYGRIHRHWQDWDAAIEAFTQSIQRYQMCQNPQGEAEGCYELGLMYKDCQNLSQARYFLQRARSLYEHLSAANEIKRVDAALAELP